MTLEETTMTFTELTADLETPGPDWRRTAVVYQIYPRSCASATSSSKSSRVPKSGSTST